MSKRRSAHFAFAMAVIAVIATGCTPKASEDTASETKSLPPAPTPNANIPDKYSGMMPGGGPHAQPGAPAPPPGPK